MPAAQGSTYPWLTPLVRHTGASRNVTGWREACDNYDAAALDQWGLS